MKIILIRGGFMKIENNNTYKQTDEVLALAQKAYRKLADYYQQQLASSNDERVTMLLEYLQGKEQQMDEMLSETIASVSEEARDTYFQYEPENLDELLTSDTLGIKKRADVNEIIEIAAHFDNVLYDYFARVAEMATSEPVATVFHSLKQKQEEKAKDRSKDMLALKDL